MLFVIPKDAISHAEEDRAVVRALEEFEAETARVLVAQRQRLVVEQEQTVRRYRQQHQQRQKLQGGDLGDESEQQELRRIVLEAEEARDTAERKANIVAAEVQRQRADEADAGVEDAMIERAVEEARKKHRAQMEVRLIEYAAELQAQHSAQEATVQEWLQQEEREAVDGAVAVQQAEIEYAVKVAIAAWEEGQQLESYHREEEHRQEEEMSRIGVLDGYQGTGGDGGQCPARYHGGGMLTRFLEGEVSLEAAAGMAGKMPPSPDYEAGERGQAYRGVPPPPVPMSTPAAHAASSAHSSRATTPPTPPTPPTIPPPSQSPPPALDWQDGAPQDAPLQRNGERHGVSHNGAELPPWKAAKNVPDVAAPGEIDHIDLQDLLALEEQEVEEEQVHQLEHQLEMEEDEVFLELAGQSAGGSLAGCPVEEKEEVVFKQIVRLIREQWVDVSEAEDDEEALAEIEERHFGQHGSTACAFSNGHPVEPFNFKEADCKEVYDLELQRLNSLQNPSLTLDLLLDPCMPLLKKGGFKRFSPIIAEEISESGLQLMALAVDDRYSADAPPVELFFLFVLTANH
jgi:hypothetical protein